MQFTKNGTKAQKFKAILYEILKELDQWWYIILNDESRNGAHAHITFAKY
jgi:hypothetical protein